MRQDTATSVREFILGAHDPQTAPRLAPALGALRDRLDDGAWHSHAELRSLALESSDLAPDTIKSLISRALKAGMIERQGTYKAGRKARDGREYRLANWPR